MHNKLIGPGRIEWIHGVEKWGLLLDLKIMAFLISTLVENHHSLSNTLAGFK